MLIKPILILIICLCSAVCNAGISQYYGLSGESWNRGGRIADFSYAGLDQNYTGIFPSYPITATVDATGWDDGTDTAAFTTAIDSVATGTVFVPGGRYVLDDIVALESKTTFKLKGAGINQTILYFPLGVQTMKGSWPSGSNQSYMFGYGGAIWVGNQNTSTAYSSYGTQTTTVTSVNARGDGTITVAGTSSLSVNQYVLLQLTEKETATGTKSLTLALYGDTIPFGSLTAHDEIAIYQVYKVNAITGTSVNITPPLHTEIRAAWDATLRTYNPNCRYVGIEDMTIEFPDVAYGTYGGHLNSNSYNGVYLSNSLNCWVKNVEVRNCDNGVTIRGLSSQNSLKNIRLNTRSTRGYLDNSTGGRGGWSGHHGISIYSNSQHNMVDGFTINGTWIHDLTVGSYVSGNVFMNGSGTSLALDHHCDLPFSNLYTNINTGAGTRTWVSSGGTLPHSGAWNVYWNVHDKNYQYPNRPTSLIDDFGYVSIVAPAGENVLSGDEFSRIAEKFTYTYPLNLFEEQKYNRFFGTRIMGITNE